MLADLDPPEWFTSALDQVAEVGEASVAGACIQYRAWGPSGAAGVVLVHGGAAHSRWWDHIGPLIDPALRVVALDLSGHGDSDRRPEYSFDVWADETVAVAEVAGMAPHPVIVGHSMGGQVALRAAARYGSRLLGVLAIDSPVVDLTPEEQAARDRQAFGPLRVYPSFDDAISRFRTMPEQWTLPYVMAHVARTSVVAVDGGWSWKFDPLIFVRNSAVLNAVQPVGCPTILMPAQFGLFRDRTPSAVLDLQGRQVPSIEIPAAAHHVMLDSPPTLITTLRTVVAMWNRWPPADVSRTP